MAEADARTLKVRKDIEDARDALDRMRDQSETIRGMMRDDDLPTMMQRGENTGHDNVAAEGEAARQVPRAMRTAQHRKAIARYLTTFGPTNQNWAAELGAATGTPARTPLR